MLHGLPLGQASDQHPLHAKSTGTPGVTDRLHGGKACFPQASVDGVFCGEPEMGAVGSFIEVSNESPPAIGSQDQVTHAKDATPSEYARKRDRIAGGNDATRSADPPATSKSR